MGRIEGNENNLKVLLPQLDIVNPIPNSIANIKGFDTMLKEVGHEVADQVAGEDPLGIKEDHVVLF